MGLTGCNEAPLSIGAKLCDSARKEFVPTSERSVSTGRGEFTAIQASVNCIFCGGGTFCSSGCTVARAGGLYSTGAGLMGSNEAQISIGAEICDSAREEFVLTGECSVSMERGELTVVEVSVGVVTGAEGCTG